jgi:hypothetical protein
MSVAPRDLSRGKENCLVYGLYLFIYFRILTASVDGVLDLPINPRRRKGETGQSPAKPWASQSEASFRCPIWGAESLMNTIVILFLFGNNYLNID